MQNNNLPSGQLTALNNMPVVDRLADIKKHQTIGLIIILSFFGVFGIWASLAPLDEAVVAAGRVIVETNRKTVQHLEGGIVDEILVKNGDKVEKNQPLLKISKYQPEAQLDIATLQFWDAKILKERLRSELSEMPKLIFSNEIKSLSNSNSSVGALVDVQTEIFNFRREVITSEVDVIKQRISQLQEQVSGLVLLSKIKKEKSNLYQKEIGEWQELFEQKLVDNRVLRETQHKQFEIKGDMADLMAKIAQIKVQILEEKEQILLKENTFKSNIVDDLRKAEFSVSEYQSKLKALNNTLSRTVIRSPDNGVVTGLEIHTIGGVIAPGDPIMFIVPSLRSFMIEAKVPSQQSEKLALSSNVDIRFPSFNSFKGVIPGVVKTVSADSFVDEQTNISYYNVKIKVSPEGVERMTKEGIQLSSGMPTEVIIKTGARTLLDYLLTPFNNMAVRSFNEQ